MNIRNVYLLPLILAACADHEATPADHTSDGTDAGVTQEASGTTLTPTSDATTATQDASPLPVPILESFGAIPRPAILIANGGTGELTLIDPSSLEITRSIAVMAGMHPHHVGVSPDKSKALVTATSADLSLGHGTAGGEHGGGHAGGAALSTMLYQLDLNMGNVSHVLTVDATAHNASFTRDGASIVLSMMEHGMVVGYDSVTFTESFSAPGFNMPLEVTPTGSTSLLVAESGSGQVAVLDLATLSVTSRFDVGEVPVAAWASGGSNYFVAAEEGMLLRHITEVAATLSMDEHVIDLGGMPGQAMLTPDGKELWVAIEDMAKLAILDATTHEHLADVAAGTKPHGIVFEPTGERAFVTDEDGGKVLVVDVSTRTVSSEISTGGKPNGIVWLSK